MIYFVQGGAGGGGGGGFVAGDVEGAVLLAWGLRGCVLFILSSRRARVRWHVDPGIISVHVHGDIALEYRSA